MVEGGYFFERSWGYCGVIVYVIDFKLGIVIYFDWFDIYRFKKESECLVQYLNVVFDGRIFFVVVNDEGF